jgi:hypothetical protein
VPAAWAADALLVVFRWLHGLAAAAFLGWALVLLARASTSNGQLPLGRFKDVLEITLLVFLATGAVLGFDRLAGGAGPIYAGLLAIKLLFSAAAYQLAFRWRRQGLTATSLEGRLVFVFGAGAALLAAALVEVFEIGLRGG